MTNRPMRVLHASDKDTPGHGSGMRLILDLTVTSADLREHGDTADLDWVNERLRDEIDRIPGLKCLTVQVDWRDTSAIVAVNGLATGFAFQNPNRFTDLLAGLSQGADGRKEPLLGPLRFSFVSLPD